MRVVVLGLALVCVSSVGGYEWERGETTYPAACPGRYCGRVKLAEGNYSACGVCPRGTRVRDPEIQGGAVCLPCSKDPEVYDYLYLLFILLSTLLSHWVAIDFSAKRNRLTREVLVIHCSALLEVAGAGLLSVLLSRPYFNLRLESCGVDRLSDWYPVLYNPTPNYEEKLYCTQEVVYPLYSIVFIFYAACLLLLMLVRPWLTSKFLPGRGRTAVYAALYFLPIYTLLHAVLGGLIYYSFPYMIIILSLISSAGHFAFKLDQTVAALFSSTLTDTRNLVILVGHWCLHAFGIIAVTELKETFHFGLLGLVPLPALFYILTARFTDPNKISAIYEDN